MNSLKIIKVYEDRLNQVNLTSEEEKDILLMKAIIGENNLNLQADGKLFIRHYVGFIQVNKTRLLIYPKISNRATTADTNDRSFKILMNLLSYSGFINIKRIPSPQFIGKYKGDLLELFINIFIDELLNLFKRDVNRNYNKVIENQSFIKGKIDFSKTVKKNSYRTHLHYVRYDNFTEDIILNKIFKAVIKNLIIRTTVRENKLKLKQGLLWLEEVEDIKLTNEIWDRVQFTRLNKQYETVFNMAKLFYYNSSPNLNKGDELTFSFLVPLNQLYEEYIFKILNNNAPENFKVHTQGPIDYLAVKDNKNFMQLKPDITIKIHDDIKYILDAKYKEVIDNTNNLNILQSDVYQMLAYSIRYKCNSISLIYPKFLEDEEDGIIVSEIFINNNIGVTSVKILKIDLEEEPKKLAGNLFEVLNITC